MPIPSPETSDLERTVLAHKRILQALIAFMTRTEPQFVDHLRVPFVEPMNMPRHQHDHRHTDDYPDEFVCDVMLFGKGRAPKVKEVEKSDKQPEQPKSRGEKGSFMNRPTQLDWVQVRERNGIWEVQVDGKFRGDYHQKEHALAAAALHKLSPR